MSNLNKSSKKVLVGTSGGVDSSVVLKLLKSKNYNISALYFKLPIWDNKTNRFVENIKEDKKNIEILENICKKLKIKLYTIKQNSKFKNSIIDYTIKEYKKGYTPNPCAYCNRFFKIKYLLDFAKKNNFDYIATGHYAKIKKENNSFSLYRGKDFIKDQSYGLCYLKKKWLSNILFPLANYSKKQVYNLSIDFNINKFHKREESQDICFLKNRSINDFLDKNVVRNPGQIVDTKGNVLGKHLGLHFYTIGQRKGIGLSKKYYVKKFNISKNQIVVTRSKNEIYSKKIIVEKFNFLEDLTQNKIYLIQTRYSKKPVKGKVKILNNNKIEIIFLKPCEIITRGQFAVIYHKNKCCGGGIICKKE